MIVQDDCGACAMAKELLSEPIKQEKLILLNIKSKEGLELVEKHKIETVPTIINEKDTFQQKCYLYKDGSRMKCEDGTERILIKKKREKNGNN